MGAEVDGPSDRKRGPNRMTDSTRRIEIREARAFARSATFGNPRYRWRIREAAQNRTLHPMLEKALWEMGGYLPKGNKPDGIEVEAARGLIQMLLRRPLSEDPLEQAKPVSATVIERQPPAIPQASIVPPARPKRVRGTAPPLKPGEEVME